MGTIAKGEITLTVVNDAYTVSLSPETCVVNADYSGNPYNLSSLQTTLTIKRGDKTIPFSIVGVRPTHCFVKQLQSSLENIFTSATFIITRILDQALSGGFEIEVKTEDGFDYTTKVQYTFSVIRESTMLDWIQDWNDNMTRISGSYILTPKIFIGKAEDITLSIEEEGPDSYTETFQWKTETLTGVYIGPDLLASGESSAGIYGYLHSHEIFHLNAEGGLIAGWTFNNNGLYSPVTQSGGAIQILSEGQILATNNNTTQWVLNADGSGSLAKGNISWNTEGSAEFAGKITASQGEIGGWNIDSWCINSDKLFIDSARKTIGIAINGYIMANNGLNNTINTLASVKKGGVMMYYTSDNDFGISGYLPTTAISSPKKVFSLGSENIIGGWHFDNDAIYIGTKKNQSKTYTDAGDHITLGIHGLRGATWYIDKDGSASFANGKVLFNSDSSAEIAGWTLGATKLASAHTVLVSNASCNGVFISKTDLSEVNDSDLVRTIIAQGGFYVYSDNNDTVIRSGDNQGNTCLFLSTAPGTNTIGQWSFDHQSIYNGSTTVDDDGFVGPNSILLSTQGLRGSKWNLLADGSGSIAGGNIKWSADGTVTFAENVSLNWSNLNDALGVRLAHIDANGLYIGTISADKITSGTIIGSSIQQAETNPNWEINKEGSGHLASGNIRWDNLGNVALNGGVAAKTLTLGEGSSVVVLKRQEKGLILSKLSGSSMQTIEAWVFDQAKLYLKVDQDQTEYVKIGENIPFAGNGANLWLLEGGMYRIVGINVIDEDNEKEITYWNIIKYSKAYDLDPITPLPCHETPENLPFGVLPISDHVESSPTVPIV